MKKYAFKSTKFGKSYVQTDFLSISSKKQVLRQYNNIHLHFFSVDTHWISYMAGTKLEIWYDNLWIMNLPFK